MARQGWTEADFDDYDPAPDPAASDTPVTVVDDAGGADVPFALRPLTGELWARAVRMLAHTAQRPACQATLDATPPRNVWIVKPAGKSRGRGIRCMDSLSAIVSRRSGVSNRKSTYVVQKYIERPLLIRGRKFDIRQWVLVTSWNPLTVWFYADSYLRFCVRPFSLAASALRDRYVHLANNSIQKHAEEFEASDIAGNMWSSDAFAGWLRQTYRQGSGGGGDEGEGGAAAGAGSGAQDRPQGVPAGVDLWLDWLRPALEATVVLSLKAAQDMTDAHPGSFELYGYDFMVDSSLRPWLIEINSSPDMSYSTAVTEPLVRRCMEDTVRVVIDHRDAELAARRRPRAARRREEAMAAASSAQAGDDAERRAPSAAAGPAAAADAAGEFVSPLGVNTGRWKLAFQAPRAVTRPLGGLPHNFAAQASPIFPPRKAAVSMGLGVGRTMLP